MANPDRYNYDPDRYNYNEEYDVIEDRFTGKEYDGDGNEIQQG